MKKLRMNYWWAWRPVRTNKGWRWFMTVGVQETTEEREIYSWYPGDTEPPTFQATMKNYICLRKGL